MKKIIVLTTAFAVILTLMSFNVSAEETIEPTCNNSLVGFEFIELSQEEAQAADKYIETLEYEETGISAYATRSNDYLFEYDYTDDYFYKQLNSAEKELYKGMYDAAKKVLNSDIDYDASNVTNYAVICEKIPYDDSISKVRAEEICRVFYYSNPQFFPFYFSNTSYTWNEKIFNNVYLCLRSLKVYMTSEGRKYIMDAISANAITFLDVINESSNPLEKELAIVKLLSNFIEYDYAHLELSGNDEIVNGWFSGTIVGAIAEGSAICEGYSMAVTYLCHLADIECIGVVGQNHAWNRVKLFGDWYEVDVTWIDTGRSYNYDYNWCNKSTEVFLAQDSALNKTSHITRADLYTTLSLPECLKNDPVVPEYILGDVNHDGELSPRDLTILGKAYMQETVTAEQIAIADVNGDGEITPKDITALGKLYMSMQK